MGVIDLLERANDLGFNISLEDDELIVRALKERAPDHSFFAELKDNKTHLKEYFRSRRQNEINKTLANAIKIVDRRNNLRIPLSYAQERLWFVHQLQGSVQYHMPWAYRLRGRLDVGALQEAFRGIVARHEVLRTVVTEEDGKGYQLVRTAEDWTMRIVDEYRPELLEQPFDLSKDAMMKVWLIKLGPEDYFLAGVIHHIAFDGWSQNIFLTELSELYRARLEDRAAELKPLAVQYADYALWQREYLSGEILQQKLQYWKQQL